MYNPENLRNAFTSRRERGQSSILSFSLVAIRDFGAVLSVFFLTNSFFHFLFLHNLFFFSFVLAIPPPFYSSLSLTFFPPFPLFFFLSLPSHSLRHSISYSVLYFHRSFLPSIYLFLPLILSFSFCPSFLTSLFHSISSSVLSFHLAFSFLFSTFYFLFSFVPVISSSLPPSPPLFSS